MLGHKEYAQLGLLLIEICVIQVSLNTLMFVSFKVPILCSASLMEASINYAKCVISQNNFSSECQKKKKKKEQEKLNIYNNATFQWN